MFDHSVLGIAATSSDAIHLIEETGEVAASFSPDEITYIITLLEQTCEYQKYMTGFLLFTVLVILLHYVYKFFRIFF